MSDKLTSKLDYTTKQLCCQTTRDIISAMKEAIELFKQWASEQTAKEDPRAHLLTGEIDRIVNAFLIKGYSRNLESLTLHLGRYEIQRIATHHFSLPAHKYEYSLEITDENNALSSTGIKIAQGQISGFSRVKKSGEEEVITKNSVTFEEAQEFISSFPQGPGNFGSSSTQPSQS